jgi:peptidyl-prolyl cis-trans isomerase B (cyclophilin B)
MTMFKTMKRILTIALGFTMMFTLAACGQNQDNTPAAPGETTGSESNGTDGQTQNGQTVDLSQKGNTHGEVKLEAGDSYAVIAIRDFGDITIKLFPEIAPLAVSTFKKASTDGYYDGLIFHRIIADFMIQGGSPNGDGIGGDPRYPEYDTEPSIYARHLYGSISTANRGEGTNGVQFFIVNKEDGTPHLNNKHTVFGQVVDGFDVLEAVSAVEVQPTNPSLPACDFTNPKSSPVEAVVMESITIHTYEG